VADGLQLVHELRVAEELRDRAERKPPEVLIETRGDDARAVVRESEGDVDDLAPEELNLVDADDLEASRGRLELRDGRHRHRPHPQPGMADDGGGVEAVVDLRLEDDDALARDLGSSEPADHLLALAAEHRPADHLEPAAAPGRDPNHGRDPTASVGRSVLVAWR
jgi:hypothetical protein